MRQLVARGLFWSPGVERCVLKFVLLSVRVALVVGHNCFESCFACFGGVGWEAEVVCFCFCFGRHYE